MVTTAFHVESQSTSHMYCTRRKHSSLNCSSPSSMTTYNTMCFVSFFYAEPILLTATVWDRARAKAR